MWAEFFSPTKKNKVRNKKMGNHEQKPVEKLTFTDDGMFQAVLRDPAICAEFVELLLGVRVKSVDYPVLEKAIKPFYTSKGVRLDVYLKDEDKVIDVELQAQPQEALGKRVRYYDAMLDMDCLMKGEDYPDLKESYVLFICKQDPFEYEKDKPFGLPRYTFRNICQENNLVNLDDKSLKVIYNASAYEKEKDEKIRALLRFVQTNEPGTDDFASRLSEIVERLKENEQFKEEYARMNLHDRDLIRETKREAYAEKAIEDAKKLLADGKYTAEEISGLLGIPIESFAEPPQA
ncbi:MAG: Rpn family recombination-promoting nuclease/putative transposase [Treponema sp.]|nr:Rpn family recombination-promoting nuclease/putative transposase [Treponema sp.]